MPCRQADAFTAVVTREPEWDDTSRGRALRLSEHEASICGCGCGQPLELARDPDQIFMVDDFTCFAERALEKVRSAKYDQAERENWPKKWDAGKHFYVRPYDPARDPAPTPPKRRGGADVDQVSPGPPQG